MPERTLLALVAHPLGPERTRFGANLIRVDSAWDGIGVLTTAALLPTRCVGFITISITVLLIVALVAVIGRLLCLLGLS